MTGADLTAPGRPAQRITYCAVGLFGVLVASTLLPAETLPWAWGIGAALGLVLCWQLFLVVRSILAEFLLSRRRAQRERAAMSAAGGWQR